MNTHTYTHHTHIHTCCKDEIKIIVIKYDIFSSGKNSGVRWMRIAIRPYSTIQTNLAHLTDYLICTPFNAFENGTDPDQTAVVRAAWPGSSTVCLWKYYISYPTLVDLTNNAFVLCTNIKVYLYSWVKPRMNIHDVNMELYK